MKNISKCIKYTQIFSGILQLFKGSIHAVENDDESMNESMNHQNVLRVGAERTSLVTNVTRTRNLDQT